MASGGTPDSGEPAESGKLATAAPARRGRGRPPVTGTCATREELCERVRWYDANTNLSAEAIGKRFGVSQGAVLKILASP